MVSQQPGIQCVRYSGGAVYVGTLEKGRREGRGVLKYSADGHDYCYLGEWHRDKRHGVGAMYVDNVTDYIGHWHRDREHGFGSRAFPDGAAFIGYFLHGDVAHGQYRTRAGACYVGAFRNNLFHGRGTLFEAGEMVHDGMWEDGERR
jgi:hypothetical protein